MACSLLAMFCSNPVDMVSNVMTHNKVKRITAEHFVAEDFANNMPWTKGIFANSTIAMANRGKKPIPIPINSALFRFTSCKPTMDKEKAIIIPVMQKIISNAQANLINIFDCVSLSSKYFMFLSSIKETF